MRTQVSMRLVRVVRMCFTVELSKRDNRKDSGGDALRGNTRTHPEHEG